MDEGVRGALGTNQVGTRVGHVSYRRAAPILTLRLSFQVYMEGALLLNELTAFGGNSEMWTCYICVLRGRSLALYSLILQDGTGRIAGAGV